MLIIKTKTKFLLTLNLYSTQDKVVVNSRFIQFSTIIRADVLQQKYRSRN